MQTKLTYPPRDAERLATLRASREAAQAHERRQRRIDHALFWFLTLLVLGGWLWPLFI